MFPIAFSSVIAVHAVDKGVLRTDEALIEPIYKGCALHLDEFIRRREAGMLMQFAKRHRVS